MNKAEYMAVIEAINEQAINIQYREMAEHNMLGIGGRFSGLLGNIPTNQTTLNVNQKPGYRKHFKKTGYTIH